jgi:Icc protein
MIIAQITDSHIEAAGVLTYGTFDAAASLTRILGEINAREPQPDLVLHTGDLVHHGAPEQYGPLRDLLGQLKAPFFALPGNHDSRAGFAAAFANTDWLPKDGEFLHYVIDDFPVRIVCLDTVIPGVPYGKLCEERLAWLEAQLAAEPSKPTIVACHHPPMDVGLTFSSMVGLSDGGPALATILAKNPQVQRVICGHVHRTVTAMFGQRMVWASPATCYQFLADMSDERTLALIGEPPGYSLHVWLDDPVAGPNLASHFIPVGDFGEPIVLMRRGERVGPAEGEAH